MKQFRDSFPFFRHHPETVYLDSAATAHKPSCVIEALSQFYERDYATVHRSVYQSSMRATELYQEARDAVRQWIHAKESDEIIFTRGTTESIHLVSRTFPLQKGDEVLVSELEHHSNLVPWQMLAQEKGIILKKIPVLETGELDLQFPLSPQTKLVAVTHASNVTGTIPPIRELAREAHRVGAVVLVDGAQAASHARIDVQDLDADFYAFSGHKCYGPTGIGVLYGRKNLLEKMPPYHGGGGMVSRVDFDRSSYLEPPMRFEAGTPIIGSAIGLKAAIDYMQSIGIEAIHAYEQSLLAFATEKLHKIPGLRIIGQAAQKSPILTFTVEGTHPLDLATFLDMQNIAVRSGSLCAQPLLRRFGVEVAIRASLALYNSREDVERFALALEKAIRACKAH